MNVYILFGEYKILIIRNIQKKNTKKNTIIKTKYLRYDLSNIQYIKIPKKKININIIM